MYRFHLHILLSIVDSKLIKASLIGVFLSAFLLSGQIRAQNINPAAVKEWTKGKNELNKGNQLKAEKQFLKSSQKDPRFVKVRLDLGSLFFEQKRYAESITWFRSALELDTIHSPNIFYTVGVAYWEISSYDSAEWFFKLVLEEPSTSLTLKQKALKYYWDSGFQHAENFSTNLQVEKLGTSINSEFGEYFPALVAEENKLFFTRRKHMREDFFYSQRDSMGNWTEALPFSEFNSKENEGAISFSADGKTALFTICDRKEGMGGCDIYQSTLEDTVWTLPVNLGPQVNTEFWESQPSLSADGQSLYFVSNRPGGFGGKDIWLCRRDPKGAWLPAENLGKSINTVFDDISPFIHFGSEYLYFASEGHPGFGGLDIFVTKFDGESWTSPLNLGAGINTRKDESGMVVAMDGITAYFNRVYPHEITRNMASDIYTAKLDFEFASNPTFYVKLRAYNRADSSALSPVIEIVDLAESRRVGLYKIRNGKEVLLLIPDRKTIAVNAYHPGFIFYSSNFDPSLLNNRASSDVTLSIYMTPIQVEQDLDPAKPRIHVLNNILFETGSAQLLKESWYELDKLYDLLTANKDMRIQINGHTDNTGSMELNQKLSENRALSVKTYLTNKGVDPSRIKSKGYGPDRPVADNDTPEGRALNRRTEFEIVGE